MTVSEAIKKTRAEFKNKTPKERWAYFWDYYTWHVLGALLVVVLLAQSIVAIVNNKNTVLSGTLINSFIHTDEAAYQEAFMEYAGLDMKKAQVSFQTNIQLTNALSQANSEAFQLVHANVAAERLDFITGNVTPFQKCAYSKSYLFADLRKHLPAETLAQLEDRLYYIDGDILYAESDPFSDESTGNFQYPDPHAPETMGDPIPVGIEISSSENFMKAYYPDNDTMYIGIVGNAPNLEQTLQFIDFLLSDNG